MHASSPHQESLGDGRGAHQVRTRFGHLGTVLARSDCTYLAQFGALWDRSLPKYRAGSLSPNGPGAQVLTSAGRQPTAALRIPGLGILLLLLTPQASRPQVLMGMSVGLLTGTSPHPKPRNSVLPVRVIIIIILIVQHGVAGHHPLVYLLSLPQVLVCMCTCRLLFDTPWLLPPAFYFQHWLLHLFQSIILIASEEGAVFF